MKDCKFNKDEVSNGIEHEICSNEEMKELNKSNGKDIPCMGKRCGKFEQKDNELQEGNAGE